MSDFMKRPYVVPEPVVHVAPAAQPTVPHLREFERLFPNQPCFYCGDVPNSVDHVIPRSKGGSNDNVNKVPACSPCNQMKSNMTLEEFTDRMKRILRTLTDRKLIQFGEILQWPVAA
jgi:hypothetical protein